MTEQRSQIEKIKQKFLNFARYEASGNCEIYVQLATWIAESIVCLKYLEELSYNKTQPNLVLAAIRKEYGLPQSNKDLESALETKGKEIKRTILTRMTQTNEPARCAGWYLALQKLKASQISLIELGSSAGLCLIPDHYRYRFGDLEHSAVNASKSSPLVQTKFSGKLPDLSHPLNIIWRCGIDLNPINVHDQDETDWLNMLIWPSQKERVNRLNSAIDALKNYPINNIRGNLLDQLEDTIAAAPESSTKVVYHSAVINYLSIEENKRFRGIIERSDITWLFQESYLIFPDIKVPVDIDLKGRFIICLNKEVIGHCHPHGQDVVLF